MLHVHRGSPVASELVLRSRTAFDAYLEHARDFGLLSADEELAALRHLVELRQRQRLAVRYRPDEVGWCLAVRPDAFAAYHAWMHREDAAYTDARNRFACANLRLVVQVARRYAGGWTSLADRVQDGNLGLLEAIERFDADRGTRFSTYAVWWIRHAIARAIVERGREIRIPPQMHRRFFQARKVELGLQAALCREVTLEELATEMKVDPAKLAEARAAMELRAVELTHPSGPDDSRRGDIALLGRAPVDFDETTDDARHLVAMKRALVRLDARSRDILYCRFGLDGGEPWTLRMVSERHQVSRERIRQIVNDTLHRLRGLIEPVSIPLDVKRW